MTDCLLINALQVTTINIHIIIIIIIITFITEDF